MMSCTMFNTKSNVLLFHSKLLKNVHVPEFEINNTAIDDEYNNNNSIYIASNQSRLLSGALQNMAN